MAVNVYQKKPDKLILTYINVSVLKLHFPSYVCNGDRREGIDLINSRENCILVIKTQCKNVGQ